MYFLSKNSFYIDSKKEFIKVLLWLGIIVFWLTFWLPNGIYLGGNAIFLGIFFSQMEVIIPISAVGILLIFIVKLFTKFNENGDLKNIFNGVKPAGLWLSIIVLISFFSRDFAASALFIPIWLIGLLTVSGNQEFFPNILSKKLLMVFGIFIGYMGWIFFPNLNISIDLLAVSSVFGLLFFSDEIPRNFVSKEFILRTLIQIFLFFIIFQSSNLIFPVVSLFILIFSKKLFVFRRGDITPDLMGISLLLIFAFLRIYYDGVYSIEFQQVIPGFWLNFREILFGVGSGQFLPSLQLLSPTLLPLESFKLPGSGLLLIQFEQGLLGICAVLLLFLFSFYLHRKRSFLYISLMVFLMMFSNVFVISENGIILFILLLFLSIENSTNLKQR